jgi:hypothetical protein
MDGGEDPDVIEQASPWIGIGFLPKVDLAVVGDADFLAVQRFDGITMS